MSEKIKERLHWPGTSQGSAEQCCKAVQEVLRRREWSPSLFLLPYNYHCPEDTTWWLSPIGEKPAYHAGKYFFHFGKKDGLLYIGFVVEKGISRSLAELCTTVWTKNFVMEEDWQWHKVMKELHGVDWNDTVNRVSGDVPLTLEIDAGIVNLTDNNSYDPRAPRPRTDRLAFDVNGSGLVLVRAELTSRDGLLKQASDIRNFDELSFAMKKIPREEWAWVNFWLGTKLEISDPESDVSAREDCASALVDKFLIHFFHWVDINKNKIR